MAKISSMDASLAIANANEKVINSIDVWEGIITGGVGGACAGISVLLVSWLGQLCSRKRDQKQIYGWMQNNTTDVKGGRFRSTRAISSWNNLTEDRVRYICSVHPKIFLSTGGKEDMWGLHARDNTVPPSVRGL